MALLNNYSVYNNGPIRFRAGSNTAGNSHAATYGQSQVRGWSPMIFQDGLNESLPHIEYPSGYGGTGWKMPLGRNTSLSVKYGLMSGQTAVITITPTGAGVAARPGSGSATFTISATGSGGLVVMGIGSATMALAAVGQIVAQLAAEGAATITITAEGDSVTALGWPEGSATFTIGAAADPMALGFMEGTTDYTVELTPEAVAASVWRALTSEYADSGSMGEAMMNAGAGGNPWSALLAANNDSDSFGQFVQKLLTTAKFIGLK